MEMPHTQTGQLKPVAPYDFNKSLDALWIFNNTATESLTAANTIARAVCLDKQAVGFQLTSVGSPEAPQVEYTLYTEQPLTPQQTQTIQDRITFFLSLDDDLSPFYTIGLADSHFAPIIKRFYGYHPIKFVTPFESACCAILSQRNLLPIAQKMKKTLLEAYGSSILIENTLHWAFPQAHTLASIPEEDLATCLGDAKRAEQVWEAAQAFRDMDETTLRTMSYTDVESWLLGIKGIGLSSASYILSRGLGRMEHAQLTEKKLIALVNKVYGRTEAVQREHIPVLASQYGQWQGYWAHYLKEAEPYLATAFPKTLR